MTSQLTSQQLVSVATLLTRYAVLLTEGPLVMPATYLFEVKEIDDYLHRCSAIRDAGLLAFAGPAAELGPSFLQKKRREYRGELNLFTTYEVEEPRVDLTRLVWIPRHLRSSSRDITDAWRSGLEPGGLWERLARQHRDDIPMSTAQFESSVEQVPSRLDGRAFLSRFAIPLVSAELPTPARTTVSMLLSRSYLESYMRELDAVVLVDTILGGLDCGLRPLDSFGRLQTVSQKAMTQFLDVVGLKVLVEKRLSLEALIRLRSEPPLRWLVQFIAESPFTAGWDQRRAAILSRYRSQATQHPEATKLYDRTLDVLWRLYDAASVVSGRAPVEVEHPSGTRDDRRSAADVSPSDERKPTLWGVGQDGVVSANDVFLVYGRNLQAAQGMKDLLRAAAIVPVEWGEAASWTGTSTPYVLDVIKAALARVGAVVVLFTPDENASLDSSLLRPGEIDSGGRQPRPNVLVEAGMALALFPRRTVLVEIGKLRGLSDLEGLHTLRFDGSAQSRMDLIERLRTAGCTPRGNDYLTKGFDYLK